MSDSLIDWGVAERVALRVGDASGADARRRAVALAGPEVAATAERAEALLRSRSGLDPARSIPAAEPVGRGQWTRMALGSLEAAATELAREQDLRISLPGPLGGIVRGVVGVGTGTELGMAAGYAARRVLGQYDVALLGEDRPARLVVVAPNVATAAAELEVELEPFLRWVILHETTHALQFATAPWLRDHLAGLVRELLRGTAAGLGLGELAGRLVRDPRDALGSLLRGELARLIAGPEQAPLLDSIQATMTLVEGHAEHLMDACAEGFVADVKTLRERLRRRRAARGPLEMIAARLLGLDLKLRQYEQGKAFCDAVAETGGLDALNRVWVTEKALPTLAELGSPDAWLERIGTMSVPRRDPATA